MTVTQLWVLCVSLKLCHVSWVLDINIMYLTFSCHFQLAIPLWSGSFQCNICARFPTDLGVSDLHALPRLRGVLPLPRSFSMPFPGSLNPCCCPVLPWQKSRNTRAIFRDSQVRTGFHVLPRLALTFLPPSPSPVNLALLDKGKSS